MSAKAGQGKAGEGKAGQRQGKARQGKAGEGKAGQGKARQGKVYREQHRAQPTQGTARGTKVRSILLVTVGLIRPPPHHQYNQLPHLQGRSTPAPASLQSTHRLVTSHDR